ncbi:Hsp20/alpha crystallin family protein [bacterium SCSIO 12741]|nr:Hsp20/alpha crystallin family protein [bacterium SCSIO 12741]
MHLIRNRHLGFPQLMNDFINREMRDAAEGRRSIPAVNIHENEKGFELEVAAPGFGKDEIKIEVHDGILHLTGDKKTKKEEKKNGKWTRKEFSYHSFDRSFSLPKTVNAEKIDASYDNGILTVKLPLKQKEIKSPKKIDIR